MNYVLDLYLSLFFFDVVNLEDRTDEKLGVSACCVAENLYLTSFLLPLWCFFAISIKFLHSAIFYFSHFSFLVWINAAFFSISYFLWLCTTQGCAWPWALFLLFCSPIRSILIAAMAQILHVSFAVTHTSVTFQLWKIPLLMSQLL